MTGMLASIALPPALKAVSGALPWKAIAIGASIFIIMMVIGFAFWKTYHAGYDAADADWTARQRVAEADARADEQAIAATFAGIDMDAVTTLHEIDKVRIIYRDQIKYKAVDVYRDRPECNLPDSLRDDINQFTAELARASGLGIVVLPAAGADEGRQPGGGD